MNAGRRLDVSHLPTIAFGPRAPLWWGQIWMCTIESTVFALMVAAYFYLRLNYSEWPPSGVINPPPVLSTICLVLLCFSSVPMYMADVAAENAERNKVIAFLTIGLILGTIAFVLRLKYLTQLSYHWNSHAYGSIVWTLLVTHTAHLITAVVETLVTIVIAIKGPFGEKQRLGVYSNGPYWDFVVIWWVILYGIVILGDYYL